MKLWELYPVKAWYWVFDTVHGFIVRAETEEEARVFANEQSECENYDEKTQRWGDLNPWLDPEQTSCVELTADGPQGVIIRDFRAG